MEVRNRKLSEEEFFKEREEVLAQWPTGKGVDLDEAIEFHKSLPPYKVLTKKLLEAKERGETYAITGMGKATLDQHIEHVKYVQDKGQAEVLGTSVDSFSRTGNFAAAEKGIQESLRAGKSVLNGLPVVNHGVAGIRRLIESVDLPVQMRYGGMDTRLIEEIAIAGGHTGTSSEALYDFWNNQSKLPLAAIIRYRQYVQRLIGYYEEKGAPVLASCQGLYAGEAAPPSLVMAAVLTGILTMAEQGVKHILLHHQTRGNLVQDVASADTIRKLARNYLDRAGHQDVETVMSAALCLLQYPVEIGPSFAVVGINTITAKLCKAQMNDIRTVSEAVTIPTKEETAVTFRYAKTMTNLLKGQKIEANHQELEVESKMQELETTLIMDRVMDLGDGDVVIGTIRAVESGVLDNPFATTPAAAGRVMGVKDSDGAVRYLRHGNLPFTKEILEFHREKIAERERKRGRKVDYETVINDLFAISKGFLIS